MPRLALAGLLGAAAAGSGATPESLRFERVSLSEGLSQVSVYCIAQDGFGFLWVGGEYGLNRYDGYGFVAYTHRPDDPASLSSNQIRALAAAPDGPLWVGTLDAGLNRWDPAADSFTRFRHDPDDPDSLASDSVRALALAADGRLWVATAAGLDRLDPPAGERPVFIHFRRRAGDSASLSDDSVLSLHVDGADRLWVGTAAGLDRLDPGSQAFVRQGALAGVRSRLAGERIRCLAGERAGRVWVGTFTAGLFLVDPERGEVASFRHDPDDPSTLRGNSLNAILQDRHGGVWLATEAWGLERLDPSTGEIYHVPVEADDPRGLGCRALNALVEDRSEILWVGTTFAGLQRLDLKGSPFRILAAGPEAALSLQSSVVLSVLASRDGSLWVGTDTGLDHIRPDAATVRHFKPLPDRSGGLARGATYALIEDRDGVLWAGTWGGGLARYDRAGERFETYRHREDDPDSLVHDVVLALFEDRAGRLWVGTLDGLDHLDRGSGRFVHHPAAAGTPGRLASDHIKYLFQDSRGSLWVGTIGGGLGRLDEGEASFTVYRHDPADPTSLSDDSVSSVMESRTGELWVGTAGGLNRFDRATGTFTSFRAGRGLPSDAITGVMEDEEGRIWVAHFAGLSRLDPSSGEVVNFDQGDGLPSNEFNSSAYSRGPGGEMYFGGVAGLVEFDPAEVTTNPYPPKVALTSFKVYGEELDPVPSALALSEVELDHTQDFISFEFVGLELTAPDEIVYTYVLDNFDRGWVASGDRRFASYTNLVPGDYTFRVKAANGAGVWGPERRVRVVMTPPFWQTWWFRCAAAAAVLMGLATVYSWRTRALRTKIAEQARVESIIRQSRDELRQANLELERYSTGLESMVEERTRQLAEANSELQALAISDGLTGVANRRRFEEVIDGEWRRAYRFRRPLSVLMVDIDHFKAFNDALGHQAGDGCLRRVAAALAGRLNRPGEVLARYGGEEFVAVLPETDSEAARSQAEGMRRTVEELGVPHPASTDWGVVTVSVGVATVVPAQQTPWTSLVERADRALYVAKAAGRNRVEIST